MPVCSGCLLAAAGSAAAAPHVHAGAAAEETEVLSGPPEVLWEGLPAPAPATELPLIIKFIGFSLPAPRLSSGRSRSRSGAGKKDPLEVTSSLL